MIVVSTRVLLITSSYALAVLAAPYFGLLYEYFFPGAVGGTWIGAPSAWLWLIGYPLALIFVLTFLLHLQSQKYIWWWNIIALAPAILFEIVLDPLHIYFPVILGAIACGLGMFTNK